MKFLNEKNEINSEVSKFQSLPFLFFLSLSVFGVWAKLIFITSVIFIQVTIKMQAITHGSMCNRMTPRLSCAQRQSAAQQLAALSRPCSRTASNANFTCKAAVNLDRICVDKTKFFLSTTNDSSPDKYVTAALHACSVQYRDFVFCRVGYCSFCWCWCCVSDRLIWILFFVFL
jgi:hypothetical protein